MKSKKTKYTLFTLVIAAILAIGIIPQSTFAYEANNERVAEDITLPSAISSSGRYVAFASGVTDLVAGDTNGVLDVFVMDRNTDTVTRVSEGGTTGSPVQADSDSYSPSISANGRYVVFTSDASNLIASDTNSTTDIFVMDRTTHTVTRISEGGTTGSPIESDAGSYEHSISANGRYVAFSSFSTNLIDGDTPPSGSNTYVMDRSNHTLTRIGDGGVKPFISANGRFVSFRSAADTLVAGDTNGEVDVFVMDRNTSTITRVSEGGTSASPIQSNATSQDHSMSDDGRYVAFSSGADNLVPGDTNTWGDIFVMDRNTHTLTRISEGGTSGSPIQADGGYSYRPSISADGRYVAFPSDATNLVTGDTNSSRDIFVVDRNTHSITRVSEGGTSGSPVGGDDASDRSYISADGRYVSYFSSATNLIAGDTNGLSDSFVSTNVLYQDADGISDSVEIASPNWGDANDDGLWDSVQQTVTSLVSPTDSQYVVLESGNCVVNSAVSVTSEAANDQQDDHYSYPAGLLHFTLSGCTIGGTETVTQYYYGDLDLASLVLRKYNSTTGTYATITGAVLSSVTIGGESAIKAVYQVTDGGPLDEDGVANGTIIDPAGIAVMDGTTGAPNTGLEQQSVLTVFILIATAGALIVVARVYARSNSFKK